MTQPRSRGLQQGRPKPAPKKPTPRRVREPHVVRTLEPLTPAFLTLKSTRRARLAAAAPLLAVTAGFAVVVIGAFSSSVLFVIGGLLVVAGVAWGMVNLAVGAPRRILARIPRASASSDVLDEVLNLVEGLCVENGLRALPVHLIDDDAANALVLGWGPNDATLVLTRGILDRCGRIELEGVIAHEIAHIKRGDMRDAAFAGVACGLLSIVSPRSTRVVDRLLSPSREAEADMGGASMTRFPPGLAQALTAISLMPTRPSGLGSIVTRLTAPNWLVGLNEGSPERAVAGRLDVDERISLLAEL